jgi:hypothetical protein
MSRGLSAWRRVANRESELVRESVGEVGTGIAMLAVRMCAGAIVVRGTYVVYEARGMKLVGLGAHMRCPRQRTCEQRAHQQNDQRRAHEPTVAQAPAAVQATAPRAGSQCERLLAGGR